MMVEFERHKQTIGERNILMTSWFDEGHQTWRASAPAYAYLSNLFQSAHKPCVSREAAIHLLCGVLGQHFARQGDTGVPPEHLEIGATKQRG